MAILNISGTINSSFSTSAVLVNTAQEAGDAIFTIDLRPTTPVALVQDNMDYVPLGWDINDVVAVVSITGPKGQIYTNEDYDAPDIVPATSRHLNKSIALPLDPLTNYANILKGNYTVKISWYNSVLDEYYAFLDVYQYNIDLPTIANKTVSGPYTGVLKSTDITEYGNDVHQIIREHRIQYPTQMSVPISDVVSSNEEVEVTPIYTNQWNIIINSFVEYRFSDLLRVFWEGEGAFTHCVYGGCIGAMYDAIYTMLTTYTDAMACNVNNQEAYQKRLVIVNTAWHLLNEAYWDGDSEEADNQAYIIQEQVEYTGGGICEGVSSVLVVPCPAWTGGGVGGTYSFENALFESGGNVVWGGSLVQDTTVLMSGYDVLFSGADSGSSVSHAISAANGVQSKASDGTTEGRVYAQADVVTLERADLVTPDNTRGYEITAAGLVEKSDYSAGYVGLSLVNKNYVDTMASGISVVATDDTITGDGTVSSPLSVAVPFTGFTTLLDDYGYVEPTHAFGDLTSTPTTLAGYGITDGAAATTFVALTDTPSSYTGFADYFLVVNASANGLNFVSGAFVPVTGGTFTGPVTIATSSDRPLILQQIGAGSTPGTPEGGTNLISFRDNDGDEQGYMGIDSAGNIVFSSWVTGAGILIDSDLQVTQDIIVAGLVDGVDISTWRASYVIKEAQWDTAYSWGNHAGLYQPLDADLTSIAELGFTADAALRKSAANTWYLDDTIYATREYVDSLALTYVWLPDATVVDVSDGFTGTNADVRVLGGDYMQYEEANSTPAIVVSYEYVDVETFNNVFLYMWYHGGAGHTIKIQLYNYDTLAWDDIGEVTDQIGWTIIDIPIALDEDYIDATNNAVLRLYHDDTGDITHYLQVDHAVLRLTPQLGGGSGGGVTDHAGLTGLLNDDHTQYALADGSRCIYYIPDGAKDSAVDAGTLGETSIDNDYIYVCVQTGVAGSAVWKRTAIAEGNPSDTFQYITYANSLTVTPSSTVYTDGTTSVRKRIVGTIYYIDVTLTATGFAGVEDTDWTWVSKKNGQTSIFRSGVSGGDFVVDGTITATGFAGVEDTDWENLMTAPGAGAETTYRDGVRDTAYVIDKTLTATGFAGVEDTDWENIVTNKPI